MRLLTTLDEIRTARRRAICWPRTGLDITAFAAALKTAKDGGFVRSTGARTERVEITDSGAKVAALARGDT